jgi:hypothetical protein
MMTTVDATIKQKLVLAIGFVFLAFLMSGCPATVVQPYDEKLVTDTEALYKKAASIIEDGRVASPRTDQEREAISDPENHPGHFSAFETEYNGLIVDTEVLILRAMASSEQIDKVGQQIQEQINKLIDEGFESQCRELADEFGKVSLTVQNYVDLKCIILRWKERHNDDSFTQNKKILKKANWEARKRIIFNGILALQQAEAFKKPDQQ